MRPADINGYQISHVFRNFFFEKYSCTLIGEIDAVMNEIDTLVKSNEVEKRIIL